MKKQTDRHFFCTSPVAGILLASLCLLIASPLFAAAIAADIRGHVIFEDTAAVASYATVQVSYSGTTQTVGAVTDGNFSIPMATDMTGTVSLIAEPPTGYETTYSNSKSLKIEITDTSTSLILPEPLKLRRLGKITGQVRKDSVTGTVVQNANIIAETQDDTDIDPIVAETNVDGVFTLDVPAKYSWTVHAEPPSTEVYKQYAFSERIPVKITDPATPSRLAVPLTLKLLNVKHISGVVTYQGAAVSGVAVSADNWYQPDARKSSVTSADGRFDMWVGAGKYELRVTQTQGAAWISPAPQEVIFSEDMTEETQTLNIALSTAEGRLLGAIFYSIDNPLTSASGPNTAVEIELVGAENRFSSRVNPDAQGKFSFPVPAGLYEISLWLDPETYPQYDSPASQTFRISKGEKIENFNFYLIPMNATVRGSVVTTLEGKGIPGVRVAAWESEAEGDWYVAETDMFGNYRFSLSAGNWTIKPLIPGIYNDISKEIELESLKEVKLDPFNIDNNRTKIAGTVTDENGKLLEDAEAIVYARSEAASNPVAESWVVKGRFVITVPNEKVYIGLYLTPGNKYCFAGDREILYQTGDVLSFKLKENKTFIHGKIADSSGKAVTGIKGHLIATSADQPGLWQSADINPTDGSFKIPAGKGLWSVAYNLETKDYLPYPTAPISVDIPAEGATTEKNITLISLMTRKIRGWVQDEEGKPVSNVEVWGKSNRMAENFFEMPVFSGADGAFEIPMPPKLMVRKDSIPRGSKEYNECISTAVNMCGSASNSCYKESKTECKDQYLRASSSREDTDVVLVLRKAEAFLEGRVLDQSGNPVRSALVSAYSRDGQKSHGNTDADGKYKLQVAKADSIEGKTWGISAAYKPLGSSICYQSQEQEVSMETSPVPDLMLEKWAELPPVQAYEFEVEKGWSYTLSDGFQIRIPGNALKTLEKNVKIMIEPAVAGLPDNDEEDNLRYGYKISVYERESGKRILEKFNKKIMFCFRFREAWIKEIGVAASDIRPAYFSEMSESWQPIKSFVRELKDGIYNIFFQTDHLSSWALVASRDGVLETEPGDVNGDTSIGLADAILALQVCSESQTPAGVQISTAADVNGDTKVGLAEVIYILRKLMNPE